MRVVLDPGHGGHDPGATFGPLEEKEIVLKVALATMKCLINCGHEVVMTRLSDRFVPLTHRAVCANNVSSHIFVSLHTNADPDPDEPNMSEATGSEIWIYPGSKEGRKLATCLMDRIPLHFPGRKFRGIKEGRFTVLSKTTMPAVLVELGFIDTGESHKLLDANIQNMIALCIMEGIEAYSKVMRG